MKVKELRAMLKGLDGEMEVYIPVNAEFDGLFRTPCTGESGVSQIADFDIEVDEHGLIVPHDVDDELSAPQKDVFMLLPHGFTEEPHGVSPELN